MESDSAMALLASCGVIHGRFQILHLDHLRYLLAGKALCEHLVVGITNPEPDLSAYDETDPSRSDPLANPLTYYERLVMVRLALQSSGVSPDEFTIVPFPVNFPDRYRHYVPMDAVFFLTIYDDWGRKKLAMFQALGLKTHVLWEKPPHEKGLRASDVRRRIRENLPWEHLVPPSTAQLVHAWNLPERLRSMNASTTAHGEPL